MDDRPTELRHTQADGLHLRPAAEIGALFVKAQGNAIHLATPPELVAGSTRLGAATVQKAALNLISVPVGIGLGHVHDGYTVNVRAGNAKLVGRAARIVAGVARVDEAAARGALARTSGGVKRAILIAQRRTLKDAEHALQQSGGHLAPLLQAN